MEVLHRADESRRRGDRHVAKPRCRASWRGPGLGSRRLRPETDYYIFGTGNPTPGYTGVARRGDNLFTCTLIAVKVATGEMGLVFQTSPHDTHDWDSAQTPILIDGTIDGVPRKLVSTAARNGYFFTIDRVTGQHLVTSRYGATTNWASHIRENGSPNPHPAKEAIIPGTLVSPVEGGVANWQPPAFSPDTGCSIPGEQRVQSPLPHRPRPTGLDGSWRQGSCDGRVWG